MVERSTTITEDSLKLVFYGEMLLYDLCYSCLKSDSMIDYLLYELRGL